MQHSILEIFSDENITGVAFKNKSLKRAIVNFLDMTESATLAELAVQLNISVPKATSLVNELVQDGLIKDDKKIDSSVGRPASRFGLVAESCFFIGVDVKRYYINIGLTDFKKNLINIKLHIPFLLENTVDALNNLIKIIRNFIKETKIAKTRILSLCVNLSGRINTNNGYSYSFFNFSEEPLSTRLEKEIGIRTYVENDSRAMAYGEFNSGAVSTEKNVLFVNMDYGLGLGVLLDGKVYYGKSGFGGELGHIPLFNNEIICQCGKKGCLETEGSGLALIRLFKEKIQQGSTSSIVTANQSLEDIRLQDIINAAMNEDVLSIELVEQIGEKIGRGLAILINIFNPELVILGGPLIQTGDYIRLPIRSSLNKFSLSLVNNDTLIRISKLGEKAGVIGGCLMARNKLLSAW